MGDMFLILAPIRGFSGSANLTVYAKFGPIVAVNGSNDVPSWRSRPFYGFVNKKIIFHYFLPKNVKNCITPYRNFEEL